VNALPVPSVLVKVNLATVTPREARAIASPSPLPAPGAVPSRRVANPKALEETCSIHFGNTDARLAHDDG